MCTSEKPRVTFVTRLAMAEKAAKAPRSPHILTGAVRVTRPTVAMDAGIGQHVHVEGKQHTVGPGRVLHPGVVSHVTREIQGHVYDDVLPLDLTEVVVSFHITQTGVVRRYFALFKCNSWQRRQTYRVR